MREGPGPEANDVVVRPETHQGKLVYVLGRAQGPGQFFVTTRTMAVAQAVLFANREGVRAWTATGADRFEALPLASGWSEAPSVQFGGGTAELT